MFQAASKIVTTDAFYLCRIQRLPDWLRFVYNCEGTRFDRPEPLPIGKGPTSWVAKTGKPKIITDPAHATGLDYVQFADEKAHTWSAIYWPMWIYVPNTERPDGVLSVQAYPHGAYSTENFAAVEWLALRSADLMCKRNESSKIQVTLAGVAQRAAQNQVVSDTKKFIMVLDSLCEQISNPERTLQHPQRI